MREVSIIIPNYNGIRFIADCLDSLREQTMKDFDVVVIDNGSEDGSRELVQREYPEVRLIALPENTGFSHAVNVGIRATQTPFVILLNNDTKADPDFVCQLLAGIRSRPKAFSCSAKMLNMYEPDRIDDAGDYYSVLGWAYARGKGKPQENYTKPCRIFACCAGAAIYRRSMLEKAGLFDDEHFAYLEDIDIGYRANLCGWQNWFLPEAVVMHAGSGTSGSRYNLFKVRYSSRNNVYMIRKNMPPLQVLINLPFLMAGFGMKLIFFTAKGFGREYAAGIWNGICLPVRKKKSAAAARHFGCCVWVQLQLWAGLIRLMCDFCVKYRENVGKKQSFSLPKR